MDEAKKLKQAEENIIHPLDDPNQLGLKPYVYAAGHSFIDALIWGTITTIAAIALLAYGRREGNAIDTLVGKLNDLHGNIRDWFARGIAKVGGAFGKKDIQTDKVFTPAVVSASVVAGSVVGHAVQFPSAAKGLHDAQKAVGKYDKVNREGKRLAHENKLLAEDNARLQEALAKIQRPNPLANREIADSRRI